MCQHALHKIRMLFHIATRKKRKRKKENRRRGRRTTATTTKKKASAIKHFVSFDGSFDFCTIHILTLVYTKITNTSTWHV